MLSVQLHRTRNKERVSQALELIHTPAMTTFIENIPVLKCKQTIKKGFRDERAFDILALIKLAQKQHI